MMKIEGNIKAFILTAIAQAVSQLQQEDKAVKLLTQVFDSAQPIKENSNKADVLTAVAQAYSQLKQEDKAANLLSQAFDSAQPIEENSNKAPALTAIAQTEANLKNWGKALDVTRLCPSHDCRVASLSSVLIVHAEQQYPELKEKE